MLGKGTKFYHPEHGNEIFQNEILKMIFRGYGKKQPLNLLPLLLHSEPDFWVHHLGQIFAYLRVLVFLFVF